METVASAMNMTSRTLRRRLLAEKTSFVAILDETGKGLGELRGQQRAKELS